MANNHFIYHNQNVIQQKYKRKSKRIKKMIKNIIFENAALCDQVAQIQDTILCVKEERRYLLKRLMENDSEIMIEALANSKEIIPQKKVAKKRSNSEAGKGSLAKNKKIAVQTTAAAATNNIAGSGDVTSIDQQSLIVAGQEEKTIQQQTLSPNSSPAESTAAQQPQPPPTQSPVTIISSSPPPPQQQITPTTTSPQQKKQQIIQTISVDQFGRPIYPIHMGNNLSVYDLGEIVDRLGYHNEHWIYPIGYISTRIYGHMKEPQRKCVYTCKIIDGGDFPLFEIIPDNDMDYAIAGPSPELCHAALLQTMNNHSNGRHVEVRPQGEWFFGLGHPTVMTLLQTSPAAEQCFNFIGFKSESFNMDKFNDPTVNYEELQKYLGTSVYHTVPEVKEEPPDELLEQIDGGSRSYTLT